MLDLLFLKGDYILKQYKLVPILLVLFLIFLQYRLWFDADGIIDMLHIKKQLEYQLHENAELKKRNDDLLTQVRSLQTSNDAIEGRARQELGMIKKGETFYQVVN
jgi:cell division protein FtsB